MQPAQVYGAVQQGFAQAGAAMGVVPGAVRPQRRNALMTFLLPLIIAFGSVIVSIICGFIAANADLPILGILGGALAGLGFLVAGVIALISMIRMLGELNSVTRSNAVAWWMLFIPIFNIYVTLILIPNEVTKAKQMLGVREPTRNLLVYWFLGLYALAADLNDIAAAMPAA
jgi:predicted transporter